MTTQEIRSKYLEFFKKNGHTVIPSSAIVPENDPTTLFTSSGMQPMLPYLLGETSPHGVRVVDSQRCFRQVDIEEVGDDRHTTFFEMLGNWSFGDYFKKEQLAWFFTFLVDVVGLDPHKLFVTVHIGDEAAGLGEDSEAIAIWQELFASKGIDAKVVRIGSEENGYEVGMQGGKIFAYDSKKNWWSRAGVPSAMPAGEPGGPDSEVFYEYENREHNIKFGERCHVNCDCGRYVEIGNSVFMQYKKNADGTFAKLPKPNIDFGGGLERIAMASENADDMFTISCFAPVIAKISAMSGKAYDASTKKSFQIIADHLRAAVFMCGEGIVPSNTEQGYVVRRLLRRVIQHADILGLQPGAITDLAHMVIEANKDVDDRIVAKTEEVVALISHEEKQFRTTLERGMKEFSKMIAKGSVTGREAFMLFTTYGFPLEMTIELAKEKDVSVDEEEYKQEFAQHQELSRTASKEKFKGGLEDTSDMSVRYHTATHLLNQALRTVLGDHVFQKGSNITPERLRFDFSHNEKMTNEQKKEVERIVNEQIQKALPVIFEIVPVDEARARGAIGVFGEKYGETVKIYRIGDETNGTFSLEFCGGPHVSNTSEIGGTFRIKKEESSSAGVRRIKAIIE